MRTKLRAAPDGYTPDICIYHDPCADGFTAAWAVQLRWPECTMLPGRYEPSEMPNVTGKHVLLVDFSYKEGVLLKLVAEAASVTILDHHISAQRDLEPLLNHGIIQGEFDMDRSGAMMAWNFCFPNGAGKLFETSDEENVPYLVRYVQDRDLWRWEQPDSKAICAYLNLTPLTFEAWTKVANELEDSDMYARARGIGGALVKKLDSDIASGIRATKRRMRIGGFDVPVANLPHFMASEAGNVLCRGEPFAATYFDTADGGRSFSLRSDKEDPRAADVSVIAASYGGGGHVNASGFRRPLGWEGDR